MKNLIAGFTGASWAAYVAAEFLPIWALTTVASALLTVSLALSAISLFVWYKV